MGLFERNYMRAPQFFVPRDGMSMIWKLIAVNAILYLAVVITTRTEYFNGMAYTMPSRLFTALALTAEGVRSWQLYRIVTAGFLHQDFWHILFNMWSLYLFGGLVAPYLPARRILWLYLIGAVSGNLLFLAFNWHTQFVLCGASGATFGIMVAAAMLEPDRKFVLMLMPFWPIRTSTMVVCFTILELLQQVAGGGGGIAHLAHLGGFLGGYGYLKSLRGLPLRWDPMQLFRARRGGAPGRGPRPGFNPSEYRAADWSRPEATFTVHAEDPAGTVSQRELDRLLDKISEQGINSLSEAELAALRRAREQMKRQGR